MDFILLQSLLMFTEELEITQIIKNNKTRINQFFSKQIFTKPYQEKERIQPYAESALPLLTSI